MIYLILLLVFLASPASADPVSAFLISAFSTVGFSAAVAATLATYAVNALINVAVGFLVNAIFGGSNAVAHGITTMVREPTMPHKLVYGTRRMSGPMDYVEATGQDGKYYHVVVLLAAHECNDILKVYFNDELVLDAGVYQDDWASFARINTHLGAPGQVADADLVADSDGHWTDEHTISGSTYLYVRLLFDQDKFPQGVPNITALVEGRKVYDPRNLSTAFSANPALCARDYMFDAKHGLGIAADEWDDTACITMANLCDETVTTLSGAEQARFECNAVVDTSAKHATVMEAILVTALGGMTYIKGEFTVFGSEYRTPALTFTEADLAGPVSIQTGVSRRQSYNGVKGKFISAENNYIEDEYPAVISSTYELADGDPQYISADFLFETNGERAQRNAKILLNKSRQQITFSAEFKLTALDVAPGDNVMLTMSRYGWSSKIFEVLSMKLNLHEIAPTITLDLRETASGVYDWQASDAAPYIAGPPTSLPDPQNITAPTFSTSDELRQQGAAVVIALVVDLSAYSSVFVSSFIVEGKLSTDTEWTTFGSGLQSKFEWLGVLDGATYDVRARVVSLLGARSDYYQAQHVISSFSSPPADVVNFNINVVNGQADLTWDGVTDLSLSSYIIRRSPLLSGASYNAAETVAAKIPTPATSVSLPYRSGTYFIRAVDQIGNESVNPASIVTNVGVIEGLNAIVTVTESSDYGGTHVGTSQDWDGFLLLELPDGGLVNSGWLLSGSAGWAGHNLFLQSEDMTNASWKTTNAAITDNGDGRFRLTKSGANARLYQPQALVLGASHSIVVDLFTGTNASPLNLIFSGFDINDSASIDPATGSITNISGSLVTWSSVAIFGGSRLTISGLESSSDLTGQLSVYLSNSESVGAFFMVSRPHTFRDDYEMQSNPSDATSYYPTTAAANYASFIDEGGSGYLLAESADDGDDNERVVNGEFTIDTSDWIFDPTATDTSAAGYISGVSGAATNRVAYQVIQASIGDLLTMTFQRNNGANCAIYLGSGFGAINYGSTGFGTNTTTTMTFVALAGDIYLSLMSTGTIAPASMTMISVQKVLKPLLVLEGASSSGLAVYNTAGASPSGEYLFDTITDLGDKFTSRVEAQIEFIRLDESGELFDGASGLFDSRSGLFDGGEFSDANAKLQISLTDDDPSGSPIWSDWIDFFVGDFAARGLKFKAVLESSSSGVSPLLTSLAAQIDMADRIVAEDDLASGAGAFVVTFSPAFKGLTGMGITEVSGMTTGDTYDITAKSAAGFTIHFRNSAGASVSRTFSYAARGFGKVI